MAVYPEGNPGAYPLDPSTDVGKFRIVYGDTDSVPYDPPEPGFQDYGELSDEEIEAYLAAGGDSVSRAIGYYFLALAGQAAKESKSVKDYDLSIDKTKRSNDLRQLAALWFERADDEDGSFDDYFDIVPTGKQDDFIAELTPVIWGRRYTISRWR